MADRDHCDLEQAEAELEEWLAGKAMDGIPELVLEGLLREHAAEIERLGYIPRTWGENDTRPDR